MIILYIVKSILFNKADNIYYNYYIEILCRLSHVNYATFYIQER